MPPPGNYTADFILTEESFHGSGLAGGWAAAMGGEATWLVTPEPADATTISSLLGTLFLCWFIRRKLTKKPMAPFQGSRCRS